MRAIEPSPTHWPHMRPTGYVNAVTRNRLITPAIPRRKRFPFMSCGNDKPHTRRTIAINWRRRRIFFGKPRRGEFPANCSLESRDHLDLDRPTTLAGGNPVGGSRQLNNPNLLGLPLPRPLTDWVKRCSPTVDLRIRGGHIWANRRFVQSPPQIPRLRMAGSSTKTMSSALAPFVPVQVARHPSGEIHPATQASV